MFRRWRGYLARRGEFFQVPPAPVVVAPPSFVPAYIRQPDSRLGLLRRPRPYAAVPLSLPVPAASLVQPDSVRWRTLRARRGTFQPVPPAPVVAAPPWVPPELRAPTRRVVFARRGDFLPVPLGVPSGVAPVRRSAVRAGLVRRRGLFFAVPPAPVVTVAPPPVPATIRPSTRRGFVARRGHLFPPPTLPGVLPGTAPTPPRPIRQAGALRLGWRPRRHLFEPPWPSIAPVVAPRVPGLLAPRRPLAPRVIRRARIDPPWTGTPPTPARPTHRRRPPSLTTRRGRFQPVIPTAPPAGPGLLAPAMRSTRRRFGFLPRRGRFLEPVWPFVPPPVFTVGQLSSSTTSSSLAAGTSAAASTAASSSASLGATVQPLSQITGSTSTSGPT